MIKELKQYRNKEAQQEMMMDEGEKDLKNKPLLVLKVAHHGSKNSTSEAFLKMLQPDIAAISCGRNNSFGHPHQETIRRLQDIGSNVAITAQYGTVTVEINENNYKLKHYKAEKAGE